MLYVAASHAGSKMLASIKILHLNTTSEYPACSDVEQKIQPSSSVRLIAALTTSRLLGSLMTYPKYVPPDTTTRTCLKRYSTRIRFYDGYVVRSYINIDTADL